jgi:hypothetical protein
VTIEVVDFRPHFFNTAHSTVCLHLYKVLHSESQALPVPNRDLIDPSVGLAVRTDYKHACRF